MADGQAPEMRQQIFGLLQGFMATAAVKAGIELELFTHIAHGTDTAEKLAAAKNLPERSTRILCDGLVTFGALAKSEGHYTLPPASREMLVKGSPGYIGHMAGLIANPIMWSEAGRLTDVVKAGHSLMEHGAEAEDNPFWHEFSRVTKRMASTDGPPLAELAATMFPAGGPKRILDIAVGSGMYGFSALKRFPEARLVSVDWPGVLKLAEPTAQEMGIADRVEFRPGDVFKDDLGSGYDLVLAVNFYHHFSIEQNLELSRRLYQATAPGGVLVIVDAVPDEKREQPGFPLAFALTMLIWTREGDTYTLSEYKRMLEPAGYHDVDLKIVRVGVPLQAIVARK